MLVKPVYRRDLIIILLNLFVPTCPSLPSILGSHVSTRLFFYYFFFFTISIYHTCTCALLATVIIQSKQYQSYHKDSYLNDTFVCRIKKTKYIESVVRFVTTDAVNYFSRFYLFRMKIQVTQS